jgi:phosphomannomutase
VLVARCEAATAAGLERLKHALSDQLKASGLAAPDFSGENAGH